MSYIKHFIDTIEENIYIDPAKIKPTNSKNSAQMCTVRYNDKTYTVQLSDNSDDDYVRQAALSIADQILHEKEDKSLCS